MNEEPKLAAGENLGTVPGPRPATHTGPGEAAMSAATFDPELETRMRAEIEKAMRAVKFYGLARVEYAHLSTLFARRLEGGGN